MIRLWTWLKGFFKKDVVRAPEVETRPTHIHQEFKPINLNDTGFPEGLQRLIRNQSESTLPEVAIGYLREDGLWYDDHGDQL